METQCRKESIGAVILAGGQGMRMSGCDKAGLTVSGTSFLYRLLEELSAYPERIIAAGEAERTDVSGVRQVLDASPLCGPLSGLVAALQACRSDALLAVAVDMPLFRSDVGAYLASVYKDASGCDVVAAAGRDGRLQPLCAVYNKECLPVLNSQLERGCGRLTAALSLLRVRVAPLEEAGLQDSVLLNVNRPEDYSALIHVLGR